MPNLETPEDSAPSLWHRAVHEDGKTRSEALTQLAASYWYCVYAWWRRAGLDVSGTTTATLATFTRWITETPPCADDSGVARMREWIPARLSELGQQGVKLTGEASISIDPAWAERRYADEPAGEPDGIFHRRWALTVLEFTAATMQAEYAARDEQGLYAELLTFAGFDSNEDEHIAAVAGRLERSVSAIGMAVVNFRSRQREVLQSFVAGTVLDPADANSEITALLCACDAPGPDTAAAPLPSAIQGLRPDEMLARAMASVRKTGVSTGGWQPPSIEEAKRLFPQYEVVSLHGRGAMGAVYRARQIELDRSVAIKLLPLEVSTDQDFADRFRREARALAKLNHPNIIMVHDFGTTSEGHLFFVMEFVDGADLHQMIHGPGLSPPQALEIISGICDALAYAHAKGVVHRDIKPANVMVGVDGQVKVADFGLARLLDPGADHPGHTMTGTIMGTPDYMAPEQMRGMNVDHRADIYSLGVMLYEMLCREVPRGIFDPPSIRIPGVNTRIDRVVTTAMQQQPDRRYQTTVEMKTDVALARESPAAAPKSAVPPKPLAPPQQAPPQPEPKPSPKAKPRKSRQPRAGGGKPGKLVYAGIGIAIAVVTVVGVILNSGGPEPDSENTGVPPAAATKDAPFVNTLGMKFVPVPITAGSTKGERVLFSVWATRVRDYETFASETKRDWPKPKFEQGPDHPTVLVTREDAWAFCEWMTLRERKAGKLAASEAYRLPGEVEWDCAVAITSSGKSYPWGAEWPPPKGTGNFLGSESKAAFDAGKLLGAKGDVIQKTPSFLEGHNDGFVFTSPVGSFAPNPFGLYDMAGNVRQICVNPADPNNVSRLRGSSWSNYQPQELLSSKEGKTGPTPLSVDGFRCVLASTSPAPATPGALAATPTPPSPPPPATPSAPRSPKQTIDLLALTDPLKDRMAKQGFDSANKWENAGGILTFLYSDRKQGKIGAPVSLLARSYEIEVGYRTATAPNRLHFDLPVSEKRMLPLEIGWVQSTITLNGTAIASIENPKSAVTGKIVVRVEVGEGTNSKMILLMDGMQKAAWSGDLATFAKNVEVFHPEFPNQALPALVPFGPSFEFTKWQLRVFEGEAKILRGPEAGNPGGSQPWVVYPPVPGPGAGKHVVFIAGDDEYRSEESLPMLAKILSQRHGFKCTVLFPVDKDGFINTTTVDNLPGAEALASADAIVMLIRWRAWPDAQMKHFADAYLCGVPIIGLRTSTHAFKPAANSSYKQFADFGKRVLGEGWVGHWGAMKREGTRGVIEPLAKDNPIVRGVDKVFATREPYEAYPPADARILMRGEVVNGLNPGDPAANYKKVRTKDKVEQDVNHPMMPIAWARDYKNEGGRTNRIFCTTMGGPGDFQNEGVRRLVINSVYALLGLEVPAKADVNYVGGFAPSSDAMNAYKKGVRPSDLALPSTTASSDKRDAATTTKDANGTPGDERTLFDGKTLTGWRGYVGEALPAGCRVVDGAISAPAKAFIMTQEEFGDFDLRFDWKTGPQGNGGIFFHVPPGGSGDLPLAAPEFQLIDDSAAEPWKTGALYGLISPLAKVSPQVGTWNTGRLLVTGSKVEHYVNDQLVCRYDTASTEFRDLCKQSKSKFASAPNFATANLGPIGLQFWGGEIAYRNLRVRLPSLTGGSTPPANAQSGQAGSVRLSPSSEPWVDALGDPDVLRLGGGATRTLEGLRLLRDSTHITPLKGSDYAVRMVVAPTPPAMNRRFKIHLRTPPEKGGSSYMIVVANDRVTVWQYFPKELGETKSIAVFQIGRPLKEIDTYELEARIVGNKITVAWDGKVIGSVEDDLIKTGGVSMGSEIDAPVLLRALQYLDLSAPTATAGPATATKEAPFVNPLGMKFVPVPITGGPTDGKLVLFSVWDTRVRDYEQFVKETQCEWLKPHFEQTPDHPAVQVSWEDAKKFCAWLTRRDRAAGKIGSAEEYRLPSDHEWSCAAGIGDLEDPATLPFAKGNKIPDKGRKYPWDAIPPPKLAGNYAGQELDPAKVRWTAKYRRPKSLIAGHDDGFAYTSPVGSFEPNPFGLYDMSGNVWQLCEDLIDKVRPGRSSRGGSWFDSQIALGWDFRSGFEQAAGSGNTGFRCVLASSASATSPPASP